MKLFEFYDATADGYQEQKDDNSVPELGELRKTKLTLKQISKLRRMYDLRNYEKQQDLKRIQAQFAPPPPQM
mgnify:FL=1|jgi:hypothetical protein